MLLTALPVVLPAGFFGLGPAPAAADELVRNESIQSRWISATVLEHVLETPEGPIRVHVDATTGVAVAVPGPAEGPPLAPARAPMSRDLGGEVHLDFHNRLDAPVELVWLDRRGDRRSYGRIPAGESRRQHTFTGHAWLAVDVEAGRA